MTKAAANKPTLLVLASTYPRWPNDHEPGFVHELSRRLINRFKVIVLCPHAPGARLHENLDGVEVFRYRYAPQRWESLVNDGGIVTNLRRAWWRMFLVPSFVLMQLFSAWRLMRHQRVDIIHAHWLVPQGMVSVLLQFLSTRPVPFVVTSHGADVYALQGRVLGSLKRFVLGRSAAASVVSTAMSESLVQLGTDASKITVLPMGVDLSGRFFPDPSVKRSAHELLFVGRLVEKKGVHYLIQALPKVRDVVPDARLKIVGFGPEEDNLRRSAAELGLDGLVSFVGAVAQSELPPLYQRAALFVAPFVQAASGDQEGLPVALTEALACGCPVVVGRVDGLEDLLDQRLNEVCVDASDVEALARKIILSLSAQDAACERALSMREQLVERMDWQRIAEQYSHLLLSNVATEREFV